jgi:Flp pilus assembly protein TadG
MRSVMRARLRRPERGAVAVEFALICIPFIVLIFGLIQYGWYFYVSSTTSGAASNVARRLEVGDCWGGTQAHELARLESPYVVDLPDGLTITDGAGNPVGLATATAGVTQIRVTLTADANIVGFLPVPNGGMVTRTVQARLEDKEASTAPCP